MDLLANPHKIYAMVPEMRCLKGQQCIEMLTLHWHLSKYESPQALFPKFCSFKPSLTDNLDVL